MNAIPQVRCFHALEYPLAIPTGSARQDEVFVERSRGNQLGITLYQGTYILARLDGSQIKDIALRKSEAFYVRGNFRRRGRAEARINSERRDADRFGRDVGEPVEQIAAGGLRWDVDHVSSLNAHPHHLPEYRAAAEAVVQVGHREDRHILHGEQMTGAAAPPGHQERRGVDDIVAGNGGCQRKHSLLKQQSGRPGAGAAGAHGDIFAEFAVEAFAIGEVQEERIAALPVEFGQIAHHLQQIRVDAGCLWHQRR